MPVSVQPGGSITVAHRTTFTLIIDTMPGASCSVSESTLYGTLNLGTAPGTTPSFTVVWGGPPPSSPWWAIGSYTVAVTCTLSGYSPGYVQRSVTVVQP